MSSAETLALIFGVLASISLILSSLSTNRVKLLSFAIACSVFAVIQFVFVDAIVAAAVITVGIVRNSFLLLSIKKEKYAWLGEWGVMIFFMLLAATVWTLVMDWNRFEWLSVVPIAGSILGSIAVFFKNLIYTKSIFMATGVMWVAYQFSYAAYGAMIGELANFVSNSIALVLLVRAAIAGKVAVDPTTEVIKTITTAMPAVTSAITTAIPVITTSIKTVGKDSMSAPVRESWDDGTTGSLSAVK